MKAEKRCFSKGEFAWFFGGMAVAGFGLLLWWPPAALVFVGFVMMWLAA